MKNRIILNSIQTPDGTILISYNRHDYKEHMDTITKELYIVDGGLDYLKRSINLIKATELSIDDSASFEIIRDTFHWGTYGKEGKSKLRWVKLSHMGDSHLRAILSNPLYDSNKYRDLFLKEVEYRYENNIIIGEDT